MILTKRYKILLFFFRQTSKKKIVTELAVALMLLTFLQEVMSVKSGCNVAPKLLQRHQSNDRTDNLTLCRKSPLNLYSFT